MVACNHFEISIQQLNRIMNKGADYEVILGWNNLRNTAKANMHKEDFRINPIVYATKIQIKMSYPFVF